MPNHIRMLHTTKLPKPSSLWSAGAEVTNPSRMVFTAGQVELDMNGSSVGDCAAQVRQAFKNMGIVLSELGMDFSNVVKFTSYLVHSQDIPAFTASRAEVYKELYPNGEYPPGSLVIVNRLRHEELVFEIDAIAVA